MQTQSLRIPVSLILLGLGTACGHATAPSSSDAAAGAGAGGESVADAAGSAKKPQHENDLQYLADGGAPAGAAGAAGTPDAAAETPAQPGVGSVPDTISPSIVSLTPEDGAVGVAGDANIVIEFSEPMAKATTIDAFASESLPRQGVELSWNDAGTILTIQPAHALDYAQTSLTDAEPLELRAKTYGYTLTRLATDLAGNPLPEKNVTFSTLREVTHTVHPVPSMTGALRGEANQPATYGFVTFDMEQLPDGIVALQDAVAHSEVPYQAPQAIPIVDVEFDELSADAITAGPGALIATLPQAATGDQIVPESAVPFLVSDYRRRSAQHRYSQFRLVLPSGMNDSDVRAASSLLAQTSVVLRYLLP
jgi:hypothetical protein